MRTESSQTTVRSNVAVNKGGKKITGSIFNYQSASNPSNSGNYFKPDPVKLENSDIGKVGNALFSTKAAAKRLFGMK